MSSRLTTVVFLLLLLTGAGAAVFWRQSAPVEQEEDMPVPPFPPRIT